MYYHLLRHVIRTWKIYDVIFYPDENSEWDYESIANYIKNTKNLNPKANRSIEKPFILKLFEEDYKQDKVKINIIKVDAKNSEKEPLIQLADLFAGIGRFSREKAEGYKKWKDRMQPSFFNSNELETEESQGDRNRFELIKFVAERSKAKGISVSIDTNNYLRSYNPKLPINFWHYIPQGGYDKAPTKTEHL